MKPPMIATMPAEPWFESEVCEMLPVVLIGGSLRRRRTRRMLGEVSFESWVKSAVNLAVTTRRTATVTVETSPNEHLLGTMATDEESVHTV